MISYQNSQIDLRIQKEKNWYILIEKREKK